jgi:hypothetical protein
MQALPHYGDLQGFSIGKNICMNIFANLIMVKTITNGSQPLHTSHTKIFIIFIAKKIDFLDEYIHL